MAPTDLSVRDRAALEQVVAVRPRWRGMTRAGEATGLDRRVLLHAGPAFGKPEDITRPILNSACIAAVYEGLAGDFYEAEAGIAAGEIILEPAQDHQVVTPLAAVVSMSMALHVITDHAAGGRVAYAPINGGGGAAMRLGQRSDAVLQHITWLNGPLADHLERGTAEPIDLMAIARTGLEQGDDGHGRTIAMTAGLATRLTPRLATSAGGDEVAAFLAAGPSFFLNLWMAACKCCLGAAAGHAGSSLITAAGGNGRDFGVQIAGLSGRWFVAPAAPPTGDLGDYPADRALGAVGDSAIVDVAGFGAMAMAYAPVQHEALGARMPKPGAQLARDLLGMEHPGFGELGLFFGLPAARVHGQGQPPAISLGILDRDGKDGRLGGGIFVPPLAPFEEAVRALDKTA